MPEETQQEDVLTEQSSEVVVEDDANGAVSEDSVEESEVEANTS